MASSLAEAGSVFCIETDGHVQVEATTAEGGCVSCPKHHRPDNHSPQLTSFVDTCCTDVEIVGVQNVALRTGTTQSVTPPRIDLMPSWAHPQAVSLPTLSFTAPSRSQPPRGFTHTRALTRSVVLVI